MSSNNYLIELLESQELKEGFEEIVALDNERENVDCIIKDAYAGSSSATAWLKKANSGQMATGPMVSRAFWNSMRAIWARRIPSRWWTSCER